MNRAAIACQLLGLSLLSGCVTLPDLELAKQAKTSGDLGTAESNFRPLAERGYVDAQIGLADLLVGQASVEKQAQGEALYRQALASSPVAAVRLGKWLANKPLATPAELAEADALLRQGVAAGDNSAVLPWVRVQLSDAQKVQGRAVDAQLSQWQAQGIGEAQLGKIQLYRARGDYAEHQAEIEQTCSAWLSQVSECYIELAGIYQAQGEADKLQALLERLDSDYRAARVPAERVQAVAKMLADNSQGQGNPAVAQSLYLSITPSFADAWCGLAELVLRYPELGGAEVIQGYLEQGVAAGSSKAALLLGQYFLRGQVLPADPQAAQKYLLQAAASEPRAHFFLGKLYATGQLGDIEPEKALQHLLTAARAGDASADVALAQLFGEGRGVRINRVYAYTFAMLAQQRGLAQGQVMVERLGGQLQGAEQAQVEALLAQELRARSGEQYSARTAADQAQEML